jgi:uncharacterized Zn finger protein
MSELMKIRRIECPQCLSEDFDKEGDMATCNECGTEFPLYAYR